MLGLTLVPNESAAGRKSQAEQACPGLRCPSANPYELVLRNGIWVSLLLRANVDKMDSAVMGDRLHHQLMREGKQRGGIVELDNGNESSYTVRAALEYLEGEGEPRGRSLRLVTRDSVRKGGREPSWARE